MLTWLHVSDIHFRPAADWRDVPARVALIRHLREAFARGSLPRPDLLFCTGDVAFGNHVTAPLASQYAQAALFFEQLLGVCQLPKERLFVVPGNHDVDRDEINPDAQATLVRWAEESERHEDTINKRFESRDRAHADALKRLGAYGEFVSGWLGHQSDPEGRHCYAKRLNIDGLHVGIAGFNSAWSCAGNEDDRHLWMAAQWQFNRALKELEGVHLRIGLVHHPIDWLNEREQDVATRRIAAQFDFWLHGHKHSTWLDPRQNCVTIGAGAVNADSDSEFGVNLVELDLDKLTGNAHLRSYSVADDGWFVKSIPHQADKGVWSFGFRSAREREPGPIRPPRNDFDPEPEGDHVPGLAYSHLGSIHLHVDGKQARAFVEDLVRDHRLQHYVADFASIDRFKPGPERAKRGPIYKAHTPGVDREELDFFSSTLLHAGTRTPTRDQWRQLAHVVNEALVKLHRRGDAGVVVELERVVATVDETGRVRRIGDDGEVSIAEPADDVCADELSRLSHHDDELLRDSLLFRPSELAVVEDARYELHFSLDIPRGRTDQRERPPFELDQLLDLCEDARIEVGGWFLFKDQRRWAYRSNSFKARSEVDAARLKRWWSALRERLRQEPAFTRQGSRLRLLAEESLAVWKTPPRKRHPDLLTVPELAEWEREFSNLSEFWVAAPNFLGDQDPEVERAMVANLKKGVKYLYFLRSNADAKRWLSFKNGLEKKGCETKKMRAYVIGFRDRDKWHDNIAFIANPGKADCQGVQLEINPLTKRVDCGIRMPRGQVEEFVKALQPALDAGDIAHWLPVRDGTESRRMAIVCLKLPGRPDDAALDRLDTELAVQASLNDGEVVHYGSTSILVAFGDEPGALARALRFATRLQPLDLACAPLRLGIDYAIAYQVARAIGLRWEGPAMRGCRAVLDAVPEAGGVYLTAEAAALRREEPWPDIDLEPLNVDDVKRAGVFRAVTLAMPEPSG